MKITICGGGSLGHVCIGVLSSHSDVTVRLLTNHPQKWKSQITVSDVNGTEYKGKLEKITSNPQEVIPD